MILICRNCVTNTQINFEEPSFNSPTYIKYCPACGSVNVIVQYNTDESWFVIAKSLNIPVAATKELYELWNPHEVANFCDWVRQIRKEYAEAKL